MKVLLVDPPPYENLDFVREGRCHERASAFCYMLPPLSLMSIASFLKRRGNKVEIKDCIANNLDYEELKKIVKDLDPGLIISSTGTSSIYGDLKIGGVGTEFEIPTAVIGDFCSVKDEWCLENSEVDFIIRNEPEKTAVKLTEAIEGGKKLKEVKGISFKKKGEVIRNEKRPFIEDTSKLYIDTRDLVDNEKYNLTLSDGPLAMVTSSRGCPHSCTFCTASIFYGKKPRYRKPEAIFEEMRRCKHQGIDNIALWGENYPSNRKFIMQLSKLLQKEDLNVKWHLTSRVDEVDQEMLRVMKKGGCETLMLGVESGSQKILDRANKNIKLRQTRKAVEKAKEVGLKTSAHMIFGLPGETRETMKKSQKFALELDPDFFNFYCAVPFPGTDFYREARRKNWIDTYDWSKYELNQSVISYPHLKAEEIEEFRRGAFLKFYSRPKKAFQIFKKADNKLSLLKSVPKFLKNWVYNK